MKLLVSRFRNLFALSALAVALSAQVPAQSLERAEELYKHTQFEASLALLDKNSHDPAVNFLLGRDYFMTGDFSKATETLQKACAESPSNSEYVDWLGRAYGKRAETSMKLMAPGWASKAREAFERSVALDGHNSDALSDLFDYYLDAPGFLGGGYEKAAAVADRISAFDPSEGFFEKARLAQRRKEFDTAEQHLKNAIAATPHKVGALVEYAKFLARQGRNKESDAVFEQAQKLEPDAASVWYAKADVLVKQKRNLEEAKSLLQKYMQASLTPDDPSKSEAARLLRQAGGA